MNEEKSEIKALEQEIEGLKALWKRETHELKLRIEVLEKRIPVRPLIEEILLAPNGDLLASRWQELCEPESEYIIEQCTGLKDKDGKEIYEGDIVRYGRYLRGIIPPESRTEIVSWWSGEEEYYPCCTTSGFALPYSEDGYEVIGNIYNDPELLEREDGGN